MNIKDKSEKQASSSTLEWQGQTLMLNSLYNEQLGQLSAPTDVVHSRGAGGMVGTSGRQQ